MTAADLPSTDSSSSETASLLDWNGVMREVFGEDVKPAKCDISAQLVKDLIVGHLAKGEESKITA